jgi:hypothetical protein
MTLASTGVFGAGKSGFKYTSNANQTTGDALAHFVYSSASSSIPLLLGENAGTGHTLSLSQTGNLANNKSTAKVSYTGAVGSGVMSFEVASTTAPSVALPKMTTAQRDATSSPPSGSGVFNTTNVQPEFSNGSRWMLPHENPDEITNLSLAASVASNALTIAVKTKAGANAAATDPIYVAMRDATAANGTWNRRSITAALSVTVSSGSTLGHSSSTDEPIYIYLIDNSGTLELAVSSRLYDDGSIVTTTAEGGAGGADSRTAIYSTTARTDVPLRLIGRANSNQGTAGTYAAVPTELSVCPYAKATIVERGGPILRKKSASAAYLNKSDGSQNYPLVVSADPASHGLMIIRGTVSDGGGVGLGEGFSSVKADAGTYTITPTTAFVAAPIIVATPEANNITCRTTNVAAGSFQVITMSTDGLGNVDAAFNFIAIGIRPA